MNIVKKIKMILSYRCRKLQCAPAFSETDFKEISDQRPLVRDEPLAASLVANHLFNILYKKSDGQGQKKCQEGALWFEDQANKLLSEMYLSDEKKSQKALTRKLDNWGDSTAIQLAVRADNKKAISNDAYQSFLTERWHGELAANNGIIMILLCIICPLLINRFIIFNEEFESLYYELGDVVCLCARDRWKKIRKFYGAPKIVFIMNAISYIIFLGLYSYVMLTQIKYKASSAPEIVLIVWTATLFLEEIRQVFSEKMFTLSERIKAHGQDDWNKTDIIMLALFILGMVLRFQANGDVFIAGKCVLAVTLLFFYVRMLHIYLIHEDLGPKLDMIKTMMKDLFYFMLILAVFMVSYAIVSESLLHGNVDLTWKYVLVDMFHKAYFHIYGELFLDGDDYTAATDVVTYVVKYLLGAYMLMCNVMLLNLLIAMFSTTYQKIQEKSEEHWKWQRHVVVFEYYSRPVLPPPFIIFNHIYRFIKFARQHCCRKEEWSESAEFVKKLSREENDKLNAWERAILNQTTTLSNPQSTEEMMNEKFVDMKNDIKEVLQQNKKLSEQIAALSKKKSPEDDDEEDDEDDFEDDVLF